MASSNNDSDEQKSLNTKPVIETNPPKPKHSSWYRSWHMLNKDQRGALISALFLAVFLPLTALAVRNEQLTKGRAADPAADSIPIFIPSPEPIVDHRFSCANTGGEWILFDNACADNCVQSNACDMARTYSCDCGSNSCWDGNKCVAENVVPPSPDSNPTYSPLPNISPQPIFSP